MKPKVQGLSYIAEEQAYKVRELEISITSKCHLRCDNCGFYIPHQPNPASGNDVIIELVDALSILEKLNIKIGSLGILGGEPTFDRTLLSKGLAAFSKFNNINQIELITHGLTPQNIDKEVFKYLDKVSISIYFKNEELLTLWKNYLKVFAPHIELSLREDKVWDQWLGDMQVDDKKAQEMFDYCWYRKHCVTIERGRLFLCSRIAKLANDDEGIILNDQTTMEDIRAYLNRNDFLPSCKNCIPMMGLPTIQAGQQPDNRITKMIPKAIDFLKTQIHE